MLTDIILNPATLPLALIAFGIIAVWVMAVCGVGDTRKKGRR